MTLPSLLCFFISFFLATLFIHAIIQALGLISMLCIDGEYLIQPPC